MLCKTISLVRELALVCVACTNFEQDKEFCPPFPNKVINLIKGICCCHHLTKKYHFQQVMLRI